MSTLSTQTQPQLLPLSLSSLSFDNRNLRSLPVDTLRDKTSRAVPHAIFSLVDPTPLAAPRVVAVSRDAFALLGVPLSSPSLGSYLTPQEERDIAAFLSGNETLPGSVCAAHCYAGHQFGAFSGQLGDGAAISLGEVLVPRHGERESERDSERVRFEIQLKGAGPTPYSRGSDGRKVLRSSIREFLCSEAMHALHVPTTRALACITSERTMVARDPFYDGHVVQEQCAVVTRVAPHFFRFGSLEIFKERERDGQRAGPSAGNAELKRLLVDHIIRSYFPHCLSSQDSATAAASAHRKGETHRETERQKESESQKETERETERTVDSAAYLLFFQEVSRRTARLVSLWQSVGFTHGVLNTDNLSLCGATIDYGPYGFLEIFDDAFVPNGSDHGARYAFAQQPAVCAWNLERLADALVPLVSREDALNAITQHYHADYQREYTQRMREKLGLFAARSESERESERAREDEDAEIERDLRRAMRESFADYTDTFVAVSLFLREISDSLSISAQGEREGEGETEREEEEQRWSAARERLISRLVRRSQSPSSVANYFRRKLRVHRLSMPPQQTEQLFSLLHNDRERAKTLFAGEDFDAIVQEIESERRTLSLLVEASKNIEKFEKTSPSADEKRERDRALWTRWVDQYIARLRRELHALSLADAAALLSERATTAEAVNPTLVLRNWMAQEAITFAEKGDFSYVRTLQNMLCEPFSKKYCSFFHNDDLQNCARSSDKDEEETTANAFGLTEQELHFVRLAPEWAESLLCTCSS